MKSPLFERLQALLSSELEVPAEKVQLQSTLIEDLGADSLDLVSLALAMEDQLGVEVGERELLALKTVGDVLTYLDSNRLAAPQ